MKQIRRLGTAMLLGCGVAATVSAQSEMDALRFTQYDLVGTARYVGMAGAFGALGGDISSFSQNPAGIGVYRGTELTTTLNFSNTSTVAKSPSYISQTSDDFKFTFDNLGYVATFNTSLGSLVSFNVGFAYNRQKTFNRTVRVGYNNLHSSLSNYAAAISNGTRFSDLSFPSDPDDNYNPYYNNSTFVPWLGILSYAGYLINPEQNSDNNTQYQGVFDPSLGDQANSDLYLDERGGINEYTFNFGGNVSDRFYFGLGVGIIDMDYELNARYAEYIRWTDTGGGDQLGNFGLRNVYKIYGTGFNFKLGAIYKVLPFWRLGFAVHTPTFYSVTERYQASLATTNLGSLEGSETTYTPYGRSAYDLRSPWRFVASTAVVFGTKGILSFDYEYTGYQYTKFMEDFGEGSYAYENGLIKEDFQGGHTFRIGAEYRVLPQFSLRAGYANQLPALKAEVQDGYVEIPTAGTRTAYYLDKGTQYYTFGLGYRFSHFYLDGAFVYRYNRANLLAFSPIPSAGIQSEVASMKSKRSSYVFTVGYRF